MLLIENLCKKNRHGNYFYHAHASEPWAIMNFLKKSYVINNVNNRVRNKKGTTVTKYEQTFYFGLIHLEYSLSKRIS